MIQKRFIAGAICPRCGQMDKIVAYQNEDAARRECVECGYEDEINLETGIPRELSTRVSPPAPPDPDVQALKIIEPL